MVSRRQVAVVVDSGACLPQQLVDRWQILVVPHELVIGQHCMRDGIDITPGEFYRLLRSRQCTPTTSAPSPAAFLEAFQSAGRLAEGILCVTPSARLSATYGAACVAQAQVRLVAPHLRVKVLDSRAAAGASGLVALAASRAAAQGHPLEEVTSQARGVMNRVQLLAFLDTLHYLARGGRLGKVSAWAGSALGIKPIFELRSGQARLVGKVRSRARATERLVETLKARCGEGQLHVNVMEADAPEEAESLRQRVAREVHCRELFTSQFTPVMGAHTGPGVLGLAFHAD